MRFVRPLLAAAAVAAALLGAPSAHAEDIPTAPVRYPPSSVRPRLVVGGLLVAGIGYGAAMLGAEAAPNWPGADVLRVPVIGPWWTLAQNGCPRNADINLNGAKTAIHPTISYEKCEGFQYLRLGLLILDGLVQAAGVAIVVEAFLMKTEATSKPLKAVSSFQVGGFTMQAAPLLSPTMAGVGLIGTF